MLKRFFALAQEGKSPGSSEFTQMREEHPELWQWLADNAHLPGSTGSSEYESRMFEIMSVKNESASKAIASAVDI